MGRQSSPPLPQMPLENILPPAEKNAVLNVGGANKAINLVENAGGASNVVKTANIMRNVGGSPEAAVAAGANAKNVKIVLQLGGPNNAVKVAAAVPKLKRRRSKKKVPKKKAPKPARVKEIKKLLGFLGAKANLQKKLPDKNNREKKLSKKEIVGKLTRFLLRK
jgi:signal recognition particle subunit SEC65